MPSASESTGDRPDRPPSRLNPGVPGIPKVPKARSRAKSCKPSSSSTDNLALEDETWYHGLLPREDITRMLQRQGDWLVRRSEVKGEAKHVLSIMWGGRACHVVLHKSLDGKKIMITTDREFHSIQELVEYYRDSGQPLPGMAYVLLHQVPRQEWELRHDWIKCDKKLGEGAFGEVFLGTLKRPGSNSINVAVKRSHTQREMSKAEIAEIVSESRIMQKFKHPNLVRLWGVAAEQQPIMLVLELISGGGLDSYLQKNKTADPMKVKFCYDAAKGVEYLHKNGCLHRDLASRNCLISKELEVKISDFGLSHEGTTYKMKATDKVPIKWLAPEAMLPGAFGQYTLRTDVWAFGIMCWEILHDGQEPYPGMRVMAVGEQVKHGQTMELDDAEIPIGMREILAGTWKFDAETRPTMHDITLKLQKLHNELKTSL